MFEQDNSPTAWESLVRTIIGFPKYLLEWTIGLVIAVLSDLHITTLAITGVALGLTLGSWQWGVILFFGLYSLSRIVALISNAIGFGFQGMAQSVAGVGQTITGVFSQAQTEHDRIVKGSDG